MKFAFRFTEPTLQIKQRAESCEAVTRLAWGASVCIFFFFSDLQCCGP